MWSNWSRVPATVLTKSDVRFDKGRLHWRKVGVAQVLLAEKTPLPMNTGRGTHKAKEFTRIDRQVVWSQRARMFENIPCHPEWIANCP